jgi:hypothetical protein
MIGLSSKRESRSYCLARLRLNEKGTPIMTLSDRPMPADNPADFPNDTNEESTHKLILQGTEVVTEVRLLRQAVDRQRLTQRKLIAAVAVLVIGLAALAGTNFWQISVLKQQMCGAVVGIVPAPGEAPPPPGPEGDRSREVIGRFRVLAWDFDCTLRQ